MKNRILYIFFFCLSWSNLFAQDTDSVSDGRISAEEYMIDQSYIKQLDQFVKTVPSDTLQRDVIQVDSAFKEKYIHDSDFQYSNEKRNSFLTSIKNAIKKFFRTLFGLAPDVSPDIISVVIKIVSFLIISVAIFFAIRIFFRHSGNWFMEKKNNNLEIDVNDVEQLIKLADFRSMIADAEAKGDTRLSIRLYYLWFLKSLKDKDVIEWLPDKTNSDYLYEIKNPALKKQFSHLSYLYEYIWYGEFSINDSEYQEAKKTFDSYLRKEANRG